MLDENNNPRKFKRNEAILNGLMVRMTKLQIGLLDQACQDRRELAEIFLRCLAETFINLKYLLSNKTDKVFEDYIEYSLREEKRLFIKVNNNISERGYSLPIEDRIKKSIEKAFKSSSFTFEQVNANSWKPWGEKIFERAKKVRMEEIYFGLFSMPSHSVHGNWQDLISHHLEYDDKVGDFFPNSNWSHIRPQLLYSPTLISTDINKLYLEKMMPECPDRKKLILLLDDIQKRVLLVDKLHEEYLQNN